MGTKRNIETSKNLKWNEKRERKINDGSVVETPYPKRRVDKYWPDVEPVFHSKIMIKKMAVNMGDSI